MQQQREEVDRIADNPAPPTFANTLVALKRSTNGQRFRDLVLSKGNTEEYTKMFRDFRGRDPIVGPMLVQRGLREN